MQEYVGIDLRRRPGSWEALADHPGRSAMARLQRLDEEAPAHQRCGDPLCPQYCDGSS